jgi:hypothetical protein
MLWSPFRSCDLVYSPGVRRRVVTVALVVLGVFAVIQLFPYRVTHPTERGNPPWDTAQTRRLVVAACYDCHSNQTRTYWYEDVAPVSWWITRHVEDGRRAMNFSTWGRLDAPLNDAADVVEHGSMPPGYYTWFGLHPSAKLSAAQRAALARGLRATAERAFGGG